MTTNTDTNDQAQGDRDSVADRIQAFADGRLSCAERTRLLREIDASEVPRWRELALVLVERDLLSEALAAPQSRPAARPKAPILSALAACVALGLFFALGWWSKPSATPDGSLAQVEVQGSGVPSSLMPGGADLSHARDGFAPESIVRQANLQLAETGYEASLFTRFVRANLKDGREVVIPISQVMLGYRGL